MSVVKATFPDVHETKLNKKGEENEKPPNKSTNSAASLLIAKTK
jgi:hypothetical protein